MDKFQHRLKTTLHNRSVESIMTRTQPSFDYISSARRSHPKVDNITTYMRKCEIDRENLNLAKRIMQCESELSRDRYVREWKKTKNFMKVRSNFKPQFAAEHPKIYKFEQIAGHGRLLVKIEFKEVSSLMRQLSSNSLFLLRFNLGGRQVVANREFMNLETSRGYSCTFFAPYFLRSKCINVKLVKVIENNFFDAGKFALDLSNTAEQQSQIMNKTGKPCGSTRFIVRVEVMQRCKKELEDKENCSDMVQMQSRSNDLI